MIYSSYHEGLFFTMDSIICIIDFKNNNNNLFEKSFCENGSLEEFVLQSICIYKNLLFANINLRRFEFV
jgi:hypothetical protein